MRLSKRLPLMICLLLCGSLAAAAADLNDPPKPGTTRVAVLGCLRQFEPSPALHAYLRAEPGLCIWVGDNVYADTKDDPDYIRACYEALEARPTFRELRETVPFAVAWDDHDYGYNNSDKTYPLKEASKAIFRQFWGLEAEIPGDRDGVYYAEEYTLEGRTLKVILLDERYNRDAPGPEADMLGEEQWSWLEGQLEEQYDLCIIVSGTQILLPKETGSETWDQYPAARDRLYDRIRKARMERVVFVTGDQHYGEVSRQDDALEFDLVELEFAGVNQIESPEFNPYRVSPAVRSRHSCAFIDIQWENGEEDPAHLVFRVFNALTGQAEIVYRVNFSELELDFAFNGAKQFVDEGLVSMESDEPGLVIRYTLDGTEPTSASPVFAGPLVVSETTLAKAALFHRDGWARSPVYEAEYRKVQPEASVDAGPTLPGLEVAYYEGAFQKLPDFDALTPESRRAAHSLDVDSLAQREDHYALLLTGWLDVPETGMYVFHLTSDDGSKLLIHDQTVVDNDGSHSPRMRSGRMALEKGLHPVRVEYFEDYMGQELSLKWETPGGVSGPVPVQRFRRRP
jgi:hypothetical protein